MPLDGLEPGKQRIAERIGIREPAKPREPVEFGRIGGSDMRLLIGGHLDAVLDAPHEEIGFGEFLRRALLDPTAFGKPRQRLQSAARP
ncbi:MAG: hypothetical protein A49_15150 [Methyloceanibacter sp.]|nr:MAG: hypothetical protein A49_15150 [Methyloceanibacter sp.]